MSIRFSIAFMLSLLVSVNTVLATNIALPGLNSSKTSTTEKIQPPVIDVMQLKADWWKALTINDETFAEHSLHLRQQLTLLIRKQPPEQQAALEDKLENIQFALDTLKRLRAQSSAVIPEVIKLDDKHYQWADWQQLLRQHQKLQVSVNDLNKEVSQQEQGQELLTKQVDSLTALYLADSGNQRLSLGLELIEKRLTWLISQESLRLERAHLAATKARATMAQDEFKLAQINLQLNAKDVQQLEQEKLALEKDIDKSSNSVRDKQALIPIIIGDDPLTRTKRYEARLQALEEQLNLTILQAKYGWVVLSQLYLQRYQQQESWHSEQRQLLANQDNQLNLLVNQQREFRPLIERYREQVQHALLTLENAEANRSNMQSQRLNQQLILLANRLMTQQQSLQQQLDDNRTLYSLLHEQMRLSDGRFKSAFKNLNDSAQDAWNTTLGWLNTSLFKMGETPVTTAGIIRVVLIIMVAWWFSYWLRKALTRLAGRNQKIADATIYTLNRVLHYLIMLIGIMVALSSIGLDFSNVAWIAGALSVGIGFGLQSIVNNFVSGLIIMFERSLKVGDFLELQSGVTGTVSQINMRSTIIRTPDNLEIVVPNSEFISGRVVNWTLTDNDRRLRIPFSVEYGTDKELVVRLVMQAARNVPYTLEDESHEPQVWMTRMGDNGLEFELLVWVRQGVDIEVRRAESRQGLRAAYLWEIESAFRAAGISMPFPQRDYYIRSILGQNSVEGFVQILNALKSSPTNKAPSHETRS
ncbi:MAG: mechanosensitive ion channel [Gammaproteobacteria bacterium]|nr:mechanosensitive ion channel [Gammaproteobacteria bacterium]